MFTQRSVMRNEYSNLNQSVVKIDYTDFNIKTTAVAAAISHEHGILKWKNYGKSVKAVDFLDFVKRIHRKMKDQKFALFMDNLSVHYTKIVKEYLKEHDITQIFNAAYYPQGNPIELVFAQVKREFRTLRTNQIVNGIKQETIRTIDLSFKDIPKEHVQNCITHTLRILKV